MPMVPKHRRLDRDMAKGFKGQEETDPIWRNVGSPSIRARLEAVAASPRNSRIYGEGPLETQEASTNGGSGVYRGVSEG